MINYGHIIGLFLLYFNNSHLYQQSRHLVYDRATSNLTLIFTCHLGRRDRATRRVAQAGTSCVASAWPIFAYVSDTLCGAILADHWRKQVRPVWRRRGRFLHT